jgi:hypothetical protein
LAYSAVIAGGAVRLKWFADFFVRTAIQKKLFHELFWAETEKIPRAKITTAKVKATSVESFIKK